MKLDKQQRGRSSRRRSEETIPSRPWRSLDGFESSWSMFSAVDRREVVVAGKINWSKLRDEMTKQAA